MVKVVKQMPVRLISVKDLLQLSALPVLALAAWGTPEHLWGVLSYALAFFAAPLRFRRIESILQSINSVQEEQPLGRTSSCMRIGVLADMVEHRLRILREYFPGGWRPKIQLLGQELIEQALNRGHGTILWVCPFDGGLVTKMALHRAGFAVSHLSLFSHGFSATRFGIRVLNPIRVSIENRYLAEKILIPADGSFGYIRTLRQRLGNNRLVSINLAGTGARRIVNMPFLHGNISVAAGPASIALATKAALLPVFTVRKAPNRFEVVIEPPLQLPWNANRKDSIEYLVRQYVTLLKSYIVRYPDLWRSWHNLAYTLPAERQERPQQ